MGTDLYLNPPMEICKECGYETRGVICSRCYNKLKNNYEDLKEDFKALAQTAADREYYLQKEKWQEYIIKTKQFFTLTQKYTLPVNGIPTEIRELFNLSMGEYFKQIPFKGK